MTGKQEVRVAGVSLAMMLLIGACAGGVLVWAWSDEPTETGRAFGWHGKGVATGWEGQEAYLARMGCDHTGEVERLAVQNLHSEPNAIEICVGGCVVGRYVLGRREFPRGGLDLAEIRLRVCEGEAFEVWGEGPFVFWVTGRTD